MPPLLEKVIQGKEVSPFVLLEDSLEQSGLILAMDMLNKTPKDHVVFIVCSEQDPGTLMSLFKGQHRVQVIDAYSNPLGWTDEFQITKVTPFSPLSGSAASTTGTGVSPQVTTVILKNLQASTKQIMSVISAATNSTNPKSPSTPFTIFFDSLSQFLISSVPGTFNLLRSITNLLSESSRIIALHHCDVPDADSFKPDASKPFATNSLAHLATTLIRVKNSEAMRRDQEEVRKGVVEYRAFAYLTIDGNLWESAVCEVEHKRKSGKVTRETNAYHLASPTAELLVVDLTDVVGDIADIDKLNLEESQTSDPAANLSFNLNLTDEQRQAKNDTVLPYLKTQESTGAIFYEPDAGDDFDDDDPDDDLTI